MKKWMLFIIVANVLCIFSSIYGAHSCEDRCGKEEKIYVKLDTITIIPEGIFFKNDLGQWIPVVTLSQDIGGLFVITKAQYQCPSCRKWFSTDVCQNVNCPMYDR